MKRNITDKELLLIEQSVSGYPAGIGVSGLEAELNLCPLSFIDVPERAYVEAMLGVYELNRIELLRDLFVWAYERSCQQYLAIRQELVPPDTFRLRYRQALSEAVKAIVLQQQVPTYKTATSVIPSSVAEEDHDKFINLVIEELENMHEGNVIRFGIRPLEFAAWREKASKKGTQ